MNVLILTTPDAEVQKVAESIASGAKEIQATVTRIKAVTGKENLDSFEFIFFGCKLSEFSKPDIQKSLGRIAKKNVGLFFVGPKTDLKAVEEIAVKKASKIAIVKGTFFGTLEGPLMFLGIGSVREADLIRARGFGERTLNTAFGLQWGGESEKSHIKGYFK